MNRRSKPKGWSLHYDKFRHNLFRNISIIHREFSVRLIFRLQEQGFADVNHQFLKLLPCIPDEGVRPTNLAQMQGISKQRISYLINEIDDQGYLDKKLDGKDNRSKRLFITSKGTRLVDSAASISTELEETMRKSVGGRQFKAFAVSVEQAFRAMDLDHSAFVQGTELWQNYAGSQLQRHLSGLSKKVSESIAQCNKEGGYGDIEQPYKIIIGNMVQDGTRVADIARIEGISKQVVSKLAIKTINAGYVKKTVDPLDARSHRLMLTKKGMEVIVFSMHNLSIMERELALKIGNENYRNLIIHSAHLANVLSRGDLGKGCNADQSVANTTDINSGRSFAHKPGAMTTPTLPQHSVGGLIDSWVTQLHVLAKKNKQVSTDELFVQSKGRLSLRPEVMYYLSNIADFSKTP